MIAYIGGTIIGMYLCMKVIYWLEDRKNDKSKMGKEIIEG